MLGKTTHALRPDAQAFDEIRIFTVPRYKTSELSGDEWRISARLQLWRKGKMIVETSYRNVETAAGFAYSYYLQAIDDGKAYFAGDGLTCDQEGCSDPVSVTYKKLNDFCNSGHKTEPTGPSLRCFCERHKTRGDGALDDADRNYITPEIAVPVPPGT